jgi:ATP-binding cassette subfamily B protein
MVGERGHTLSGGERQRISIARAVLHDPRILILDEATSSVDTETERQIQQALERLTRGRTVFAIAHRLSTLRRASRLFVVEHGRLAESGTHAELLAHPGGIYRRLYEMQLQLQ